MLQLSRSVLFSFLSLIVLAAFVGTIPNVVQTGEAQVISEDWRIDIEQYVLEVDKNTTAEIVIYVVDSLYGHGIEKDGTEINDLVQLGVYIFNDMELYTPSGKVVGIGKKGKDNGVLVLIAMQERAWRIEIGYGLEGYITDAESKRIGTEYLEPYFREGNYGEGLSYTVIALASEIPVDDSEQMLTRGRYIYDTADPSYTDEEVPDWVIILIVIFVVVMITFGGRLGSGRIGGGGWGRSGDSLST